MSTTTFEAFGAMSLEVKEHKIEHILQIHHIFTDNFHCARITELQLNGCNLQDLPDVMCSCINIVNANLSHNKFKNVPPLIISSFSNLEHLDLSHNLLEEFNYPIKSNKLKRLILSHNMLHDLPKWLWYGNLPDIIYLDLSGNKKLFVMTDICDIMDRSILIEKFNVIDTKFNETVLKILSTMPKLKELSLGAMDCENSNDLMAFSSNEKCSKLAIARLCNISLYDIFLEVGHMVHLVEIDLRFNNLTWLPQNFGCLISLKVCFLSNNRIIMLPDSFGRLINLEIFHISNNQLCSLPNNLSEMCNLIEVDIYNNEIDKLPDGIAKLHGFDFALNYIEEFKTPLYTNQKEFLRSKYNFNLRNNDRKVELLEQSEEELPSDCSISSSGGNYNSEVINTNIEIWDSEEEWVPEYNDDYWEPSQDAHLMPQFNAFPFLKSTIEHQTDKIMHYEDGQFSDY